MPSRSRLEELLQEVDRLAQAAGSAQDFMWELVKLLHDGMLKYNWVGFYMLEENLNRLCWRWDLSREP
jgi:putative methionine-R-sulfoxide reductase with GAF domain